MRRLTYKRGKGLLVENNIEYGLLNGVCYQDCVDKLGQLEDIEQELGIDLVTFLKGINPNTCFMEITRDKKFDFCGDAYYGTYSKEQLLKLIQELLFMYWALTREELEK